MQQPPPDRSDKNPYATPTAWPRAPETTFHLRVPKPPSGTQAAKPAPKPAVAPRPARPGSSILTGSALPVGYTAPQRPPEAEAFELEPAAPSPPPAPEPVVEAAPEPDYSPAPPFIAPRQPTVVPSRRAQRRENRAPLIAGAVVTALVGIGAAAWLLLREPEPVALETTTIAPAAHEPVIVPPSFEGLMSESEAQELELRGPVEPVQSAPARRTAAQAAPSRAAVELPSRPVPYSGDATPTIAIPTPPAIVLPSPVAPPPASAPGPRTPIADPDAPLTTRDPTSGD